MKCSVYLRCLIWGLGLMLAGGCSMSRGSLASRKADSERRAAEELAEDDAPVKIASHETESDATDDDAPPGQPGVKSNGGSRKKLSGWLKKDVAKSASIPLDRTDKSKGSNEEALAEEDSGFWKHNDTAVAAAPLTAGKTTGSKAASKTNDSSDLSLESKNPFDE